MKKKTLKATLTFEKFTPEEVWKRAQKITLVINNNTGVSKTVRLLRGRAQFRSESGNQLQMSGIKKIEDRFRHIKICGKTETGTMGTVIETGRNHALNAAAGLAMILKRTARKKTRSVRIAKKKKSFCLDY